MGGRGPLAAPPVTDPGRWAAWLDDRGPIVAAFSLLRVAALAVLWYLVLTTALGAVLRMVGAASLVHVTDRFTIAPVRRLLAGSVGMGLAASGLVALAPPALRSPVGAAAAQQVAPSTTEAPPATVTMHRLGPAEPSAADRGVTAVPADPDVTAAPPATVPDRWAVKPGDCFWSIAESVLADHWGRSPTDAEIVPYWHRLIDANRSELASRDDPDLILPGQVFVVPAP